ncbi:DUF2972 domain-containing protein, partial [Campylobacter jejuni]|nr:DUF2972 domain-containing protein [Campylobacter jejuni]EAJ8998667.1 DUF2972 domain-containing protein [Campylobacter jejuni]EEA8130100.1 DUF2972 domain-containing protein [Campylobacter jejuni]EKP4979897.1 DUF2972 domain-containing protein [Campylobacter jejuni]
IQIFPQLKYPSLETCGDYEQALRYKFHLSYMLGEVLIKADKTWHKGSGFKLKNDIKKANKEFQIFREIFKEFDQINSSILEGLINNKQLFLKEFPRIKNILKIHQDYKAILDNIFHNFNYFIQNFDLIEEWLLSDDFNERYKKGSHPYPSLLDPKKLNDENEKINYKNIPAELAWEMNLPLPDRYEFVIFGSHGVGMKSVLAILKFLGYHNPSYLNHEAEGKFRYYQAYVTFLSKKIFFLDIFDYGFEGCDKYLLMIAKKSKCIYFTRDPICILETYINAKIRNPNFSMKISIDSNLDGKLNLYKYVNSLEAQKNFIFSKNMGLRACYFEYSVVDLLKLKDILYIDMNELQSINIVNTFIKIFNFLNISLNINDQIKNINFGYSWYFNGLEIVSSRFSFFISTHASVLLNDKVWENYSEITDLVSYDYDVLDFKIFVKSDCYALLINDEKELKKMNTFLKKFIQEFQKQVGIERSRKITPSQYLKFLFTEEKKEKTIKLKELFDYELQHIKQHRPDIVASWKYYQEFERMCKELDENNQNPSL